MDEASSSPFKPSIVTNAILDAVSADTNQAVLTEVMFAQAGPEQAQERYAFMMIFMKSHLTNFACLLPMTMQVGVLA